MRRLTNAVSALSLLFPIGLAGCFANPLSGLFSSGPSVRAVNPTPANPTIAKGAHQTFVANVTFSDGTMSQEKESQTTWTSSDKAVATIDTSGVATGLSIGTTTITAKVRSVSGSTVLTVTAQTQAVISVSGSYRVLNITLPGTQRQFIYATNPLDNTISAFQVNVWGEEQKIDTLAAEPSRGPVWLAVNPSGKFLYVVNHESHDVSGYAIDPASGKLSPVIGSPFSVQGRPWAISIDHPTGQFAEVTQFGSPMVSRYRIDPLTGTLSLETGTE